MGYDNQLGDEKAFVEVKPKNVKDEDVYGRYNTYKRKNPMLIFYIHYYLIVSKNINIHNILICHH